MSLTKIPFILLATWGFNTSMTPPNPPPPEDERIALRTPTDISTVIRCISYIFTILQSFAATAEIATILAFATPSWPISKVVLSLLVWSDGKPDNLRISNAAAVGFITLMLGTWIRLSTYRYLGKYFRFEASIQKDHELIASGPYSVVRHPSYTGLILVFIAWFPWYMSKGSWVMESGLWNTKLGRVLILLYINIIIFGTPLFVLGRMSKEDAALRKRFGTKWNDWAKRVPYSIFPGIY